MPVLPLLRTHRHDTNDRALVTLSGEIDLDSVPVLREALAGCLHDGIRTIDVDLAGVVFCDCSGLNAFLNASALTFAAGARLRLHYPSPAVTRLLTLTGCASLLGEHPTASAGAAGP